MRRSARAAKSKLIIEQSSNDEDEKVDEDSHVSDSSEALRDESSLDEGDTSEDEWRPEKKLKRGKRERAVVEEEESDEEITTEDEEEGDDLDAEVIDIPKIAMKKSKMAQRKKVRFDGPKVRQITGASLGEREPQAQNADGNEEILAAHAALEAEEEADRLEIEAAKVEAVKMWDQVRKKKEVKNQRIKSTAFSNDDKSKRVAPELLTSWLGIQEPEWPTTCEEAIITDRDSLFIGYVYTLTTPSLSTIAQMLSHLGKSVHPKTVPTEKLPPSMRHLPVNRRGAMHDIHAWRCLTLKIGRTGLNGPDDFGLEEGAEDDGEKYGAQKISRIIKQLGATDVLVIVSRWYGGTLLGPVRFTHIENCARAALAKYMINEALIPLKEELKKMDEEISKLRLQIDPSVKKSEIYYDNLEYDKAERLIAARKKAIEMLQKKLVQKASNDTSMESVVESVPVISEQNFSETFAVENDISQADKQALYIVEEPPPIEIEEEEDPSDLTGWDALDH